MWRAKLCFLHVKPGCAFQHACEAGDLLDTENQHSSVNPYSLAISTTWLDLCQEKMCLKAPSILLWVWHWLQNIIYEGSRVIFYSQCHTQKGLAGPQPAHPSLGMTTTKTLRSVFSWRASHRDYFSTVWCRTFHHVSHNMSKHKAEHNHQRTTPKL